MLAYLSSPGPARVIWQRRGQTRRHFWGQVTRHRHGKARLSTATDGLDVLGSKVNWRLQVGWLGRWGTVRQLWHLQTVAELHRRAVGGQVRSRQTPELAPKAVERGKCKTSCTVIPLCKFFCYVYLSCIADYGLPLVDLFCIAFIHFLRCDCGAIIGEYPVESLLLYKGYNEWRMPLASCALRTAQTIPLLVWQFGRGRGRGSDFGTVHLLLSNEIIHLRPRSSLTEIVIL